MLKYTLLAGMLASGLAQARTIQLTTTNTVLFRAVVTEESVETAELQLLKAMANRHPGETIYLVMDSPGGSINAGENFIQLAKLVPHLETISIFAASMASAIVEALPGKRLVTKNGTTMFHRAKGGFQGQFENGEVESRLNYAKAIVRAMEERNSSRMGMDLPSYKDFVKDELWIYGESNIAWQSADEVVDISCSKQLIEQRVNGTVDFMFGTAEVQFSGCPLLTGMILADAKADAKTKAGLKEYLETYRQKGIFTP